MKFKLLILSTIMSLSIGCSVAYSNPEGLLHSQSDVFVNTDLIIPTIETYYFPEKGLYVLAEIQLASCQHMYLQGYINATYFSSKGEEIFTANLATISNDHDYMSYDYVGGENFIAFDKIEGFENVSSIDSKGYMSIERELICTDYSAEDLLISNEVVTNEN